MRKVFSSRGLMVSEAGTAEAAVGAVTHERPDLILLDINLPDRTGWYPDRELPLARALRGHASEADTFFRPPYQSEGIWLSMSARPVCRTRRSQPSR